MPHLSINWSYYFHTRGLTFGQVGHKTVAMPCNVATKSALYNGIYQKHKGL